MYNTTRITHRTTNIVIKGRASDEVSSPADDGGPIVIEVVKDCVFPSVSSTYSILPIVPSLRASTVTVTTYSLSSVDVIVRGGPF